MPIDLNQQILGIFCEPDRNMLIFRIMFHQVDDILDLLINLKFLINNGAIAAVLGAAICAGVGVGLFKDIREGVSQMVAVDQTFEPKPENAKIYDELYDIYCRMYEGLDEKGVFQALAKFQERV